jgi:hypothetical protein
MIEAETDKAVLVAKGNVMDIVFKIEIVEVTKKC